jgi:hypothetical protein
MLFIGISLMLFVVALGSLPLPVLLPVTEAPFFEEGTSRPTAIIEIIN